MLVLSATFPTSRGCWVAAEVNSRTNVFLPCVHCPDSLSSVNTMSLVFCVWITFRSAPQTVSRDRLVSTVTPSTRPTIMRCISCFSSLVLLEHCAHWWRDHSQRRPSPPHDGAHDRAASKR